MKLHYSQTKLVNMEKASEVSVPYEITLLSNCNRYILKKAVSFSTLWNYTTLKPWPAIKGGLWSFSTLWNYTTLKPRLMKSILFKLFQYLMKLHYSQTVSGGVFAVCRFQYLMKLHYSQTIGASRKRTRAFQYLMKLHYSQTTVFVGIFNLLFQYLMKLHYSQTTLDDAHALS